MQVKVFDDGKQFVWIRTPIVADANGLSFKIDITWTNSMRAIGPDIKMLLPYSDPVSSFPRHLKQAAITAMREWIDRVRTENYKREEAGIALVPKEQQLGSYKVVAAVLRQFLK